MFDFLPNKKAKILILWYQLTTKDDFCFRICFKPLINAVADHPNDGIVSGDQQPYILLLIFHKLLTHKEIAQQLGAFHAQGMEAVAVAPTAQG